MSEMDDREFDDYLRGDSELSRLYRALPEEKPSSQIRAAVMRAAQEPVKRPRPAYTPFSSNWMVPASLAAVIVVSVTVVLLIPETPTLIPTREVTEDTSGVGAAPAVEMQTVPLDSASDVDGAVPRPAPAKPDAPTAAPQQSRDETAEAKSAAPVAPAAAEEKRAAEPAALRQSAEPAEAQPERRTERVESKLIEEKARQVPQASHSPAILPQAIEQEQRLREQSRAPRKGARALSRDAATAPESEGPPASEWLQKIAWLLERNRLDEARKEVEGFRKAYPEKIIPANLRALLGETNQSQQ